MNFSREIPNASIASIDVDSAEEFHNDQSTIFPFESVQLPGSLFEKAIKRARGKLFSYFALYLCI